MTGDAFDDADVVRCYEYRPPYAPALFEFLLGQVPRHQCALDLGCGPGKIAATLADHFGKVVAVDPSGPMIAAGRERHAARHPNIHWIQACAEDAPIGESIDLAVAGASIHWMDHDVVFPKLAERTSLIAVIFGDEADQPPWQAEWVVAMTEWLARLGVTYDPVAFAARGRRYEAWIDIAGRETFTAPFRQRLEDFIACQHSRAALTRARMGTALAQAFDDDLAERLRPWTDDGMLAFEVHNHLVWGSPRRTPRP